MYYKPGLKHYYYYFCVYSNKYYYLLKTNMNVYCVLAKKLFYHQRTKQLCVIGEVKTIFFATTIN